jgi:hypothetical protein
VGSSEFSSHRAATGTMGAGFGLQINPSKASKFANSESADDESQLYWK